jgi:hypothetical protein
MLVTRKCWSVGTCVVAGIADLVFLRTGVNLGHIRALLEGLQVSDSGQ